MRPTRQTQDVAVTSPTPMTIVVGACAREERGCATAWEMCGSWVTALRKATRKMALLMKRWRREKCAIASDKMATMTSRKKIHSFEMFLTSHLYS